MRNVQKKLRSYLCLFLALQLMLPTFLWAAQPQIPGLYSDVINTLPEVPASQLPIERVFNTDEVSLTRSGNKLVIQQKDSKVIIDWDSFNIGEDAWTHFDQQGNTDWTALNRIYDSNPSLIFGQLTADGRIFLINQNGILFGPNSQVDVYGMAASSLDIAEAELEKELDELVQGDIDLNYPQFSGDEDRGAVSNHGEIQAGSGGYIYLVAPDIENAGSLDAPSGQVALAAGTDVEITTLEGEKRLNPYVFVDGDKAGTATNLEGGSITADTGVAGMYGRIVNQKGYIRSITAVSSNGRIELHASEKVVTGANSVTEAPITDSTETVHSSFDLTGGEIEVAGLDEKEWNVVFDEYELNKSAAERIEHNGEMTATSGTITMSAEERIYLANGSLLDVSGEWVSKTADSSTVTAQLNSVELKNDYAQKGGVLQGETIEVLPQEGSTIGDLSAYLDSEYMTAKEMATAGGEIDLTVADGDIIVREEATIDFSGGGTVVEEGYYSTTKLVSGNTVYDISSAPATLQYDGIINYNQTVYSNYGLSDTYEGIYFGGANSLLEYTAGYIEGDNAGKLVLEAAGIVLDGILDGSATAGIYQTETTIPEIAYGEFVVTTQAGVKAPRGGTLVIGKESPAEVDETYDYVTDEVVIAGDVSSLPDDFSADTDLKTVTIDGETPYASDFKVSDDPLYRTLISDDVLNEAGISDLIIGANNRITVAEDAELTLQSGGLRVIDAEYTTGEALAYSDTASAKLQLRSSDIEYYGDLNIPGAEVDLYLRDTPDRSGTGIYLAEGSTIDVSGEVIDNSMALYTGVEYREYLNGGTIVIDDRSYNGGKVVIEEGAELDVSGGYKIDVDGSISAGSAGSLEIGGNELVVDGNLYGYSLLGEAGGSITLHSSRIRVEADAENYESDDTTFVLDDDQLALSGFTDITLKSYEDLVFGEGSELMPSLVKMVVAGDVAGNSGVDAFSPVSNYYQEFSSSESMLLSSDSLVTVSLDTLTGSSITAQAGQPVVAVQDVDSIEDTYSVQVEKNAVISVSPGGDIDFSGLVVDIAGTLSASAGTITLEATGDSRKLTIHEGGVLTASGTNLIVEGSMIQGVGTAYESLDGGLVSLAAPNIVVESGAIIDVSGSTPVESFYLNPDNINNTEEAVTKVTTVSDAGSIELAYTGSLALEGELLGQAYNDSVHGASLSIINDNLSSGLVIDAADIDSYTASGFDALAFSSLSELIFSGDISAELGLSLVLDAPLISGTGGDQQIYLAAPSITLANTQAKYGSNEETDSYFALVGEGGTLADGDASSSFTLSGAYVDVIGSIGISGFETTTLSATGDIQLTDEVYYDNNKSLMWQGLLRTPGDLVVQASRVYPTTLSNFTLASDTGRITILPGEASTAESVIVSAGGSLTLAAEEIDHQGYLAAPLGTVLFRGSFQDSEDDTAQTVFLADGSVTTVAADSAVQYGILEDIYWTTEEKPTELTKKNTIQEIEVANILEKTIEITADTAVVQSGAEIDISGGGRIFASEFIPGTEGYENPFKVEGTYVIVPGINEAGEAVYLEASSGLPAGTYTLLSEEYAYLEGAYVIQYVGSVDNSSGSIQAYTDEGYEVVVGYETFSGTEFVSSTPNLYSIRSAEETFERGEFNVESLIAGDAGAVDILATTTILDGSITSNVLDGYDGGVFSVSGTMSAVVRSTAALGSGYAFDDLDDIVEDYIGTVMVLDSSVSESGIDTLNFGSLSLTETVVIEEGASLVLPAIVLNADSSITIGAGSYLSADQLVINTPEGLFTLASTANIEVADRIDLMAKSAKVDGLISSDGGTLGIESDTIVVVPDEYTGDTSTGFFLTESLQGFSGFDDVELRADESLIFMGETDLTVADTLTLDAAIVTGSKLDGDLAAGINARNVYLVNTGDAVDGSVLSGALNGSLAINVSNELTIGHGDIALDAFDTIKLAAAGDILFSGEGSLSSSGDLAFSAARLTTTYYEDGETEYESADFSVVAGNEADGYRDITIASSGGSMGETDIAGGNLEMTSDTIFMNSGVIDATGAWVTLTAKGASDGNGIRLNGSSEIDVSGNDYAAGGRVVLVSDTGSILLGGSSRVNVSAGSQGDAGVLTLTAPQGEVMLNGTILGNANGGDGGSFNLDANSIPDIGFLAEILGDGGFDNAVDLRTRSGNIELAENETLKAHEVGLTADSGDVVIAGIIDASGTDGGDVRLNAGGALTLETTGRIDASTTVAGGDAGSVYLNAAGNETAPGQLTLAEGSEIDVSTMDGGGGSVHLRAQQTDTYDDVQMDLAGAIYGASQVTVEGVRIYSDTSISDADISGYYSDVDTFLANSSDIQDRFAGDGLILSGGTVSEVQVVPGIEVTSGGDMTLSAEWDISDDGRSDQMGYITLRAAGDLNIDNLLVDHPTAMTNLNDGLSVFPDSWGFNLIAGSDLESSDFMDVVAGVGDLVISEEQVVYTENNTIRFASGNDTLIYGAPEQGDSNTSFMINTVMVSNIATFYGDIYGDVGRNLVLMDNSVIQSATGDIEIDVQEDLFLELTLSSGSAIRSTGTGDKYLTFLSDWDYGETHGGGDILLDIGGNLHMGDVDLAQILLGEAQDSRLPFDSGDSTPHLLYWDNMYNNYNDDGTLYKLWSADYGLSSSGTATAGVATMGGGSIKIVSGQNISGQIGTFKDGDLSVHANGDISGYYQVADGDGAITALGNIASPDTSDSKSYYAFTTSLALLDANVSLTAGGNIEFGTVFNPTFVDVYSEYASISQERILGYGETSSVVFKAENGDISLSGSFWTGEALDLEDAKSYRVLPSTVSISAGGDIQLQGQFLLAPSAFGNLTIYAGGNIEGLYENNQGTLKQSTLRLSDLNPDDVYGVEDDDILTDLFADETEETSHAGSNPLHEGNDSSVTIVAEGDIEELKIISPKQTSISAGGDISGLYFFGQNINSDDVTVIQAMGNIDLNAVSETTLSDTGIVLSGPGLLIVQAGESINLGVTNGIQNVGNAYYSALSEENSTMMVIAGLYQETTSALETTAFFDGIREYGTEYSELLAEGNEAGVAEVLEEAENELILPLYERSIRGAGDINMTNASIQTSVEGSDIFILANGDINVGETRIPDPDEDIEMDTGIFTTRGGAINIFALGDVNVNESRVMTFRGGDITVWSDGGDINAGRGSKTAVNAGSPEVVAEYDEEGNVVSKKIVWEAPAVGSGIRTLTYDPDGFQGPEVAPEAGNAYVFAPEGVVDAGEAGIAGSNVIIGATEVLNAQNIEVGGTSVGVPQANTGPSVAALAGAGTVSEAAKSMEDAGVAQNAEERFANAVAEISDSLVPKWLAVEVIGFVEENGNGDVDSEDEDDKG